MCVGVPCFSLCTIGMNDHGLHLYKRQNDMTWITDTRSDLTLPRWASRAGKVPGSDAFGHIGELKGTCKCSKVSLRKESVRIQVTDSSKKVFEKLFAQSPCNHFQEPTNQANPTHRESPLRFFMEFLAVRCLHDKGIWTCHTPSSDWQHTMIRTQSTKQISTSKYQQ